MLYNMVENRPLTVVSELKVLINLTKVLEKSLFLVGPDVWEPCLHVYAMGISWEILHIFSQLEIDHIFSQLEIDHIFSQGPLS